MISSLSLPFKRPIPLNIQLPIISHVTWKLALGYKTAWHSHYLEVSISYTPSFAPFPMSYYTTVPNSFYNSYSPAPMYGSDPYDPYSANSYPPGPPHPAMQQHYLSQPYYSHPLMQQYIRYYDYYREPNVLNRLLNRARYGTGSYFGNPYSHTRVTFDPQGNRIWPEANYVSSVKDLWKTSDPYADP
ncbi:hypothetical protein [Absidia glauca]|uniref:Uncharacterized protein n=1 Tax=Absidia glauca TaxID=4829 RepID=A0A168QYB1_ABSGL|nr:hypothetical protein [Absidia glauca]